jgi:hypothetical protein
MGRIVADISVSLDGFVTGPDAGPDNGLGLGGDALHTWAFSQDPKDRSVLRQATTHSGAVILGRRPPPAEAASVQRGQDLDVVVVGGGATSAPRWPPG